MVLTAGLILSDVVGAGILSMGVTIAKFGWVLGTIVTVVTLAMNVHVSILMWRVVQHRPNVYTYMDLAAAGFASAPEWQRSAVVCAALAAQQLHLFTTLALFSLTAGKSFGMLFYNELRICLPTLAMLAVAIFLPLQLPARSLGHYPSLIALDIVTIVGSVFIPLVYIVVHGAQEVRPEGSQVEMFAPLTLKGLMAGLELVCFSFSSQKIVVEVVSEMKAPQDFPKACALSAAAQAALFLTTGLGAYFCIGNSIHGIIGDSLPFNPSFRVAAACLLVHMWVGILTKGVVFGRNLLELFDPFGVNDTSTSGLCGWFFTILTTMSFAWLLGQLVPFFEDFLMLKGCTVTPMTGYFIPLAVYSRWLYDGGGHGKFGSWPEVVLLAFEFAFAALIMTAGSVHSVADIVHKWRTYGAPFACHCTNLYATCGCSPKHAGMEECLLEPSALRPLPPFAIPP